MNANRINCCWWTNDAPIQLQRKAFSREVRISAECSGKEERWAILNEAQKMAHGNEPASILAHWTYCYSSFYETLASK